MSLPEVKLTDPKALRGYAHPLRMALIGLLRQQGPMTATQAAERLGESVPNCSFHLRQLAKYGLAERAPGADARERPWRATALNTSWDDVSDDPQTRAAVDELSAVQLALYTRQAEEFLTRRADESTAWRAVTGFGDRPVYVTPEEMAALSARIDALLAEYDDRIVDPTKRPAGSRKVRLVHLTVLADPPPAETAGASADSANTAGSADTAAGSTGDATGPGLAAGRSGQSDDAR
ncbi:helix-turn-helix domain-containing protein [Micromonospora peucetia]|uniref:Helix-turn-helix domain-containing protein n=1 Tax=Micromonospora peucetia TaxID=47871 RepID=A0A1C6UNY4_9ACTN|nr:helix-turn-helix domain-containing protein [Micromonospora peucetia]MCX4387123.1 helix-turn-helix domain-containing protein [Micromonospora peucetia]WSA34483.1 helix-turn-helix domain-containing protein [Micromonospora peucetia]SCL55734.1 transcriptional regulator, ArsR family [Micromonospora peucetia]